MASTPKIDLSNIRDLLKIYQGVLDELSVIELRDPVSKTLHKIAPFLKMATMYVPRLEEIRDGTLTNILWKINHFLTTVDYFVDQAGFPEGKLPDEEVFCPSLQIKHKVFTDAFGVIQDVDDVAVIAWYDYVTTFPPKLYNEMNKHIAAELRKRHIPCDIKHDEPFGALIAFQNRVVFRLVKQTMSAQDQIAKAISELEHRPITTRNDILDIEGEANILLTLKEIAMSKPKFHYDHDFQIAVLGTLECQKTYGTTSDHIRAAQTCIDLRGMMRRSQVTRDRFFEKLHDIFPPNLGNNLSERPEYGAHLSEVVFQASHGGNAASRTGGRKENVNPQVGKRKATTDEPSAEFKLLQDLKSENGNMRALLTLIVDHLGINTNKKRKGQDEPNKPPKTHAALAKSQGQKGKPKKPTQKAAISLPRHYISQENSTDSESSGNESPVQHAMYACASKDPMPRFTVQSIFGPKSRHELDQSKTR